MRIVDKNAGPAPFSRALGVQARTLEFYQQLGLADDVVRRGLEVPGVNMWVKGVRAARVPFARIGEGETRFPFLLIFPQDEHERLLLDAVRAAGVTVERDTELAGFEERDDVVRVTLRRSGAEEICNARYLAGCDGAHSTVRETLGMGFPGGSYERLFYVADVDASGPVMDRELHLDLDESNDMLAVFPLKAMGRARFVGIIRDDATAAGRTPTYDDVSHRAIERLRLKVSAVNWFSLYRVHHRVAPAFRRGRAFLLGDAAHIHSPVGGQGMNTGIGDAVNLAWKLAAVLGGAPERLLDTYEPERIAFARRLVATTDRVFTAAAGRGPLWLAMRDVIAPRVVPLALRVPALRRFFFRTIAQLNVRYPRSPLSRGRAGRLVGGDRLPWVDLATGDNFASLTSLAWTVQVVGPPARAVVETARSLGMGLFAIPWGRAAARAGLCKGALYVIRPDGYIGLADPNGSAQALAAYVAEQGIGAQNGRLPP